ncbi:MAG: hypothetical protein HN509_06480 [Halobacteriovoraceae bacterium]|jgi:hypothetical protein|nr:hypothetical protein [Halobacteriovoraceae bacterium]MBT5092612.1 hypothetical protein [Halobacteriovoraceae bacterium]
MKTFALITITLFTGLQIANAAPETYTGTTFQNVWDQVSSDAYSNPKNKISYHSLVSWFRSKIKDSAERTLSDRSDLLPQFQKLAHPNGVCLKGTWNITEESKYSGNFKKGSQALIIARASTAMSGTTVGKNRGFGLAGKIYPTMDKNTVAKTASFFLVDDLGGTKATHYTDVEMTNEPKASVTATVLLNLRYALKLASTFGKADENPGMRQVYMISGQGEANAANVTTPKWMMVKAAPSQTVDKKDFRDELQVENYGGVLLFDINVASVQDENGKKNWKKIGQIRFTDSVVSNSCDHRLHFFHPKWKSALKH